MTDTNATAVPNVEELSKPTEKFEDIKPWIYIQGMVIPSSIVTNLASLIYIKLRLKINGYIATILTLDSVFKVLLMTTAMVGYWIVRIMNYRDFYMCSLHLLPTLAAYVTCYIFSSATSVIR